ncbi:Magnetosome protein MamL [Desulfamplus magnetovallimortis]|uniref:Magnetosome protein MamL n=2 Tax=Desulfamplus magnetovallimortis TaxID=1246637 RepID=L0R6R0_9BACT|nr:LapA family protein [Desulfamplus magnetovallimortis]AET24918.1 magnetosome protein [Desulfamplus magnetovallimortis BW-1]CCO06686.1 Magnetosome protein MamL [Desulfamplus magnetovallimortis BW-1]SLM32737.1 Magnetosome protein MamL [Desulfamplus magnetovallimortis]
MFKTIMTIVLTVVGVLFSMQNFDHVPVYFFSGKPVNIRLIFVIAICGLTGYLMRHFFGIAREERLKRQIYLLKRNNDRKLRSRSRSRVKWADEYEDDHDEDDEYYVNGE